jgi:hypothetical protein
LVGLNVLIHIFYEGVKLRKYVFNLFEVTREETVQFLMKTFVEVDRPQQFLDIVAVIGFSDFQKELQLGVITNFLFEGVGRNRVLLETIALEHSSV